MGVDQKNLASPIHCLQALPGSVIVAGLGNGQLCIWNLGTNQVSNIQAHQSAVTAFFVKDTFLVSGDA